MNIQNLEITQMPEVERHLATIRRIAEIRPIEGADNIVCAVVDGWELVTQKSNGFQVGDLVVYFEIDSVLPELPMFEFLRDRCYVSAERSVNGAGFRLKTIKLRGQVSQGLILPIEQSWSEEYENRYYLNGSELMEGDDLTGYFGVVKFEKPLAANLAGTARGNFPLFLQKTDQERIQNCFGTLQKKWIDHTWEATTKLDGSSFTAYYRTHPDLSEGQFGVCSRNLDLQETAENSFWQAARKYDLEKKLRSYGRSLAIQGELMGPGIQGNRENFTELKLFIFDVYDIDARKYLLPYQRYEVLEHLDLQDDHVPVQDSLMSLKDQTVQTILKMAEGPSINHKIREGIVFKSNMDPTASFKAISNKFLLSGGDE